MPFPTAPILDTGVRANEGPPPSADWTGGFGGGLAVESNQIVGTAAGNNVAYWNAATADPVNYEIAAEFPLVGGGLSLLVIDPATFSGHYIFCNPAVPLLRIEVLTGGVPAGVVCTTPQLVVSGDAFGMRRVGSNFTLWYSSGGGAFTQIASGTDSNHSAISPRYAANITNAAGTAMIDFVGGAVVPSTLAPRAVQLNQAVMRAAYR